MAWMQTSTLGHFMRESGPWTYAVVNLTHILGLASLFGSAAGMTRPAIAKASSAATPPARNAAVGPAE